MRTPVKPKYMYETNININAGLTPQIPRTVYEYYWVCPFFLLFSFFLKALKARAAASICHIKHTRWKAKTTGNLYGTVLQVFYVNAKISHAYVSRRRDMPGERDKVIKSTVEPCGNDCQHCVQHTLSVCHQTPVMWTIIIIIIIIHLLPICHRNSWYMA